LKRLFFLILNIFIKKIASNCYQIITDNFTSIVYS